MTLVQQTTLNRLLSIERGLEPTTYIRKEQDDLVWCGKRQEAANELNFLSLPTPQIRATTSSASAYTSCDSLESSQPSSIRDSQQRSLPSSSTSVNIAVDITADPKFDDAPRRPSILMRLRSSISTAGVSPHIARRSSVQPSDFCLPPEQPEKHFIDSIGMVIPGVCNRDRCKHPLAHFVTNWRLCEPIEYTSALAEHGITYSDYSRLLAALAAFLDAVPNEHKRASRSRTPWWHLSGWSATDEKSSCSKGYHASAVVPQQNCISESSQQSMMATQQAAALDKLLEEISWNWQQRGLPVMVCVSSYSLFTSNCILGSFIQILHVSRQAAQPSESFTVPPALTNELPSINTFISIDPGGPSVAVPRRRSASPPASPGMISVPHYQQLYLRDRSKPWPLWPNAIPSHKRDLMNDHADRYGVDPYFRGWMRANINSRTKCTSYAKYMIEQENDPFVNTRLEYVVPPRRRTLLWNMFVAGRSRWRGYGSAAANRGKYEHNRRLECRKTIERGSRLRLASFGFRHPIYPPHTPEMTELGLTFESYQRIIGTIEDIYQNYKTNSKDRVSKPIVSWSKLRRRSTEDAPKKASEYIRQINASDRRTVWTIEKIPGVYSRGWVRDKEEWEISVWNGEDPLELLIELEKCAIIEKRLGIGDDE